MVVFQITLDIFLLENVRSEEATGVICKYLDRLLCENEEFISFHEERRYKNYCFNSFFPISPDKVYHKDRRYKLQLRTVDMNLAEHFSNLATEIPDRVIKVVGTEVKLLPKKNTDKLYCVTPCIMKTENGYWQGNMTTQEFALAIQTNLVKKYKHFTGQDIDENFELIRELHFVNRKPISCKYKNVNLLGDKVDIMISEDAMSQELAYFALGTGILEGNSRGFGFVNSKWRK